MYIIINKTKNTRSIVEGNFPNVEDLLNNGDKIIIISTYSNTIKVPFISSENGYNEVVWEWEDYNYKSL
ncbi:MAG: hypothetical protein WCP46_00520 [Alphaproteobacteria bacterium]